MKTSLFVLFLLFLTPSVHAQEVPSSVTVLASSSLTNVMTELVQVYSVEGEITVSAQYESPDELARAIESGQPADIYISEHPTRMEGLKRQGLIDVFSLTTVATNNLVLAASTKHRLSKQEDLPLDLDGLLEDINEQTLLVMADPDSAPAGLLARRAMEKMGHWKTIEPNIIRAGNTRNALYLIAKGNNAGVVYYTDVVDNPEVLIIARFPEELHDPIVYQAAVVAGENMQRARQFLDFLKSDRGETIFRKHGFPPITP